MKNKKVKVLIVVILILLAIILIHFTRNAIIIKSLANKVKELKSSELNNYNIKEYIINNYKNLVISNTEENNLDIIFCAHLDVVPANNYIPRCLR